MQGVVGDTWHGDREGRVFQIRSCSSDYWNKFAGKSLGKFERGTGVAKGSDGGFFKELLEGE